tara:strand:+ start:227 stop:1975 length:1749 start_codon:yes stop_codon:yes gene_type:complete
MKKLLLVIVLTAMGMFKGHSQALVQTYMDRCTGQVRVFSVPMNGSTVVAFYDRSRVFTSQEFSNGTLQAWLEETYLWWTALSPCSTTTTGAQATQQTTQQTTQQATQAATNAAQQAATTTAAPTTSIPAPTTPTTNAPPTTTSPPPTTEAPQTTSPDTSTANTNSSSPDTSSSGTNASSSGTNETGSGSNESSSTETQSGSESTDSSSTETSQSTEESTETTSTEETSTEDSSNETTSEDSSTEETSSDEVEETTTEESTEESTESETEETTEESTEEESTEESTEEESTEEESETEETDEESSEEESDESSEEESEEETEEEESESDEDEDSDEEESEEESSNEDEEEDDKKKKKRRNLAPPIVTANAMSQQLPTGEFQQAVTFGISQSSLLGDKTYGLNAMVYDNLNQFMLNANYSKVHINDEGRINRVYSASVGAMKMFTTFMGMMNHSMTFLGKKGSVAGIALGTSLTSNNVDVIDGNIYFDNTFLGVSLTSFYTKSFQLTDKIGVSPMLAVSSPFMMFDMYKHTTMWNKDVMIIAGSGFTYKLTQRFGINVGANIIESTAEEFPTMKTFTIGGRLSF